MNTRVRTLGAAAFALIAVTVSTNTIYDAFSDEQTSLLIPSLQGNSILTGQAAGNIPVNEFTPQQVADGVLLPADAHNFFRCDTGGSVATDAQDIANVRTWSYEFSGSEPPFNGAFYISPGELAVNPEYGSINTLQTFKQGSRYYQMGAIDLRFKCGEGLSLNEYCGDSICQAGESAQSCAQDCNVCGDGIVFGDEQCDDNNGLDDDGCDVFCEVELGYSCDGEPSQCSLLIPTLPGGEPDPVINLFDATLDENDTLKITYTKNFDTCAHIYTLPGGRFDHGINFICNNGGNITVQANQNQFNDRLSVGDMIQICHGNDASICSGVIQITSESQTGGTDGGSIGDTGTNDIDASVVKIRIDGPASTDYDASQQKANLGNIYFETEDSKANVDSLFIAIQGVSSENTDLGEARIHNILHSVHLRNTANFEEIAASRLASSVDSGKAFGSEEGTFQIYRFDDIELQEDEAWQLLANFTGNEVQSGDSFRIHICGEPTHVPLSNVSDEAIVNTTGCDFGGMIFESTAYQMFVSKPSDGSPLTNVQPRGDIVGNYQRISGGSSETTGSLYVTESSTPVQSHQLLGGTLGEDVLRLTFRAEGEDIDVTDIQLPTNTQINSIDRLELYREGENQKFAEATKGGCGSDTTPSGTTFCANMETKPLVIPSGSEIDVIIRPRMKTDQQGGMTGEEFSISVDSTPIAEFNAGSVRARGDSSANNLAANNGDNTANGEIFIGTSTPGPNNEISGAQHVSVLSKITSITNANPDADGTAVPVGVSAIGQFTITAASHDNSKNGDNDVAIDGMIFDVNAGNVVLDASSFKFYNKADDTKTKPCQVHYLSGETFTANNVSGSFRVACTDIDLSNVDGEIDEGSDATFVLQADVTTPKLNPASESGLQVTLTDFTDPDGTFGVTGSHILWLDVDQVTGSEFHWVESDQTSVQSTNYRS